MPYIVMYFFFCLLIPSEELYDEIAKGECYIMIYNDVNMSNEIKVPVRTE